MTTIDQILEAEQCLSLPGVFDAFSARIAERAGFPMAFVSGYSVSAVTLGAPDFGLLTQTETVEQARRICQAVSIPVLVDADTGYGNAINVQRTVSDLVAAGAAGCFLEDQVWPKRCGHMRGKSVISKEEYLKKIEAAVDARGSADFFIVARTDSLATEGLDEAISRIEAAREIGANASFVEAPRTEEEIQEIGRRCRGPNVANMISGGRTPRVSHESLAEIGFHIILHPLCSIAAVAEALGNTFQHLHAHKAPPRQTVGFDELNAIVDLESYLRKDSEFSNKENKG